MMAESGVGIYEVCAKSRQECAFANETFSCRDYYRGSDTTCPPGLRGQAGESCHTELASMSGALPDIGSTSRFTNAVVAR